MLRLVTSALLLLAAVSITHAEGRVAVIDSRLLFASSGIQTWVAARAKLDGEKATWTTVEAPGNVSPPLVVPDLEGLSPAVVEQLRRDVAASNRKTTHDEAWAGHEHEVLDPIIAATYRALTAYAKAHQLDLVLDRTQLDVSILVMAAGVDITAGFIKDFNAHHKADKPPEKPRSK